MGDQHVVTVEKWLREQGHWHEEIPPTPIELAIREQLGGLSRMLNSGDLPHGLKSQKLVEHLDGYSEARELYVSLLK